MKTTDKQTCPVCNTLLDSDSDVCPICALKSALQPDNHATATELRFEHYQILKNEDQSLMELGHGSMGVTYKALDVQLQRPVALKIINAKFIGDASARQRFVREARAAASVRHPSVATAYHLGEIGGDYFYAMEFVEGETLEKIIQHAGRLSADLALEITAQVAAGLEAIQEQHLVHRDIKPSNIMIRLKDGQLKTVKIIDLGLAKGVAEQETISAVGSFTGTPGYASPEQFGGLGADIRSDLYSLGITLWEMLSGKPPFEGSATELMYQHQHTAVPLEQLKGVPPPIVALLNILLEKDPSRRFQVPLQLQRALAKVKEAVVSGFRLSASELRTIADQTTDQSPTRPRRKRIARGLIASTVSATALLLGWFFFVANRGPFFNRRSADSVATERSIAVLPFDNISPNKDDAYFTDGVQDEILNNLAKIAQLKVISRTSVMQYRGDNKRDLRKIASALGVANVLEGTVRRNGNHVRVSTELVDARSDNTIWADSYERDLTDIFAIQNEIAQTVASKLSAQLSPEEQKKIGERPTTNLEAYDLYLQAKELVDNFYSQSGSDILKASKLLEEAIRKDPKFTLAYCLAATAYDDLYAFWIDKTPERRALADAAIDEALRLEPDSPDAHLALAYHLYASYRNYERASVQIALAQRALPNSSDALFVTALIDFRLGRWEEAINALEKAYGLDPRNPNISHTLGWNYLGLRRFREAEKFAWVLDPSYLKLLQTGDLTKYNAEQEKKRAELEQQPASKRGEDIPLSVVYRSNRFWHALFARDWAGASRILAKYPDEDLWRMAWGPLPIPRGCGEIYLAAFQGKHPMLEGRFKAAREELARKVLAYPDDVVLLGILGEVDALLGRKQEAIGEATRAVRLRPISQDAPEGACILESLALVYTWTNEPDLAFQELAILIKTPPLPLSREEFAADPQFDPIRKDPRFDKLLAQIPRYQ